MESALFGCELVHIVFLPEIPYSGHERMGTETILPPFLHHCRSF